MTPESPLSDPKSDSHMPDIGDWNSQMPVRWDRRPLWLAWALPLICVVLGLGFMIYARFSSPQLQTTPVDKDAEIAHLKAQLNAAQPGLGAAQGSMTTTHTAPTAYLTDPALATPQPQVMANDPAVISRLAARLDRLEANQHYLARVTAAATAAAELQQAARTSRPFLSQLALVERTSDDVDIVTRLRPLAEKGVPSDVELALAYPKMAAIANIAAKTDGHKDDLIWRARRALSRLVSVRHIDNPTGEGVEARLQRAELALNSGDLATGVAILHTLPVASQSAIKPWLDKAEARLMLDASTAAITEKALARLSLGLNQSSAPLPLSSGNIGQ